MIKKLLKWFWRGNADENIEQKEYESMSGLVEEFGDEQEQEDPRRHPDEFVHFLDQYKKQKLEKSGHSKGESLQAKAAKADQQLAATEYRLNSLGVDLDEVA